MSSESIDLLWNESIHKLKELVQQEDDASSSNNKPVSINDAFSHFAKLYIQYTHLLNNFNTCYSSLIQPQKRIDIKKTLELIICRVINLRFLLVKWHPPNSDVVVKNGGIQPSFPWEYLDITKELQELSVSPSQLITCTPSYFKEDQLEVINKRNATVVSLLQETFGSEVCNKLGEKSWPLVESSSSLAAADIAVVASSSSVASAVDDSPDVQTTEEEPTHHDDTKEKKNRPLSEQQAATKVQSTIRGHQSRNKTSEYKVWLDNLVGLSNDTSSDTKNELHLLENNLSENHQQRYQEQKYCKESYENDLHRLKNVVKEEEGFNMSNQLRDERTKWITDYTIKNNSLPDSFEDFYKKDLPPTDGDDDKENKEAKGSKQKKDTSAADKKSKDKKDAILEVERPTLAAPQSLLDPLKESIQIYEERWMHRTVGEDRVKSQSHDVEMAKDLIVRDQVRSELTKGVEEKLLSNILKIKTITEKSKSKKGKDGKGKKKGGGKKAGGKKEKPLPGAKLPEIKDMSVDEMLGILVKNGLVSLPDEEYKLHDFIGGFDNGRPKLSTDMDKQERWIPQDPSSVQLRKTIMEYCILPLGSADIKSKIQDDENIRSVLFYGPEGSGKTLMVQTIASEIGALMINLLSSSIKGDSFEGKEGATKLIHMVFTIAREKSSGPVLIHIDDCHEFFMGKGKSKSKGGASNINTEMQRFQKDLLIYKNQALKKEDRVLVIGCTNMPEICDIKLLRWKGSGKPEKQGFFEKSLYFPRVNHSDREMVWKEFIQRRISQFNQQLSVSEPSLDYAALAFISDGYNAGQISWTVDAVLTEERSKRLSTEPLVEVEFASHITAARDVNDDRFLNFTRQMTTLDTVWKSINAGDKSSSGAKKKK